MKTIYVDDLTHSRIRALAFTDGVPMGQYVARLLGLEVHGTEDRPSEKIATPAPEVVHRPTKEPQSPPVPLSEVIRDAPAPGICNQCQRPMLAPMRYGPDHARSCGRWAA